MTNSTFGTFRRVLLNLGFVDRSVAGSHVLLEHKGSGAVVLLRPYRDDEVLDPVTLAGTSRILDEKGVIERSRLEELLREPSLAG